VHTVVVTAVSRAAAAVRTPGRTRLNSTARR
jgi:hypothetical protein